jgi:transcriptional regulator with XRE-family HTH domain
MKSIRRSIAERNDMKPPSENIFTEVEEFFASPPTVEEKAWGLIHDFYHILLTYMEQQQITKAELAKRLGTSRSAITQMFNKTPNLTLKKMVEIAEAIGVNICLSSPQLQERQEDKSPSLYVTVQHVLSAPDTRINFRTAPKRLQPTSESAE